MASTRGIDSVKQENFEAKSKERLLSRKGYSEFGFNNSQYEDDEGGSSSDVKCGCFRSLSDRIVGFCNGVPRVFADLYKMGSTDPRKVFFAIKMGLPLATVSMLMILRRHLNDVSQYSIWAIITVVVVFEFTVGGTLSKGLNRGLGTFSAGALALGNAELSVYFGKYQEAPPKKRQVFASELQRVGNEGAKVLHELGTKLEKMEKLSPGVDLLLPVREAAEELQTKVDLKSYLLVNSESWAASGKQPKKFENQHQDHAKDDNTNIIASRSSSLREWTSLSSESIQQPPLSWPRVFFVGGPAPVLEQDSKVYESASSLSLATFSSLLIEFVARLQELGEKARFKEEQFGGNVADPGFWTRLKRCFHV
ncbi:unnamed protein product [Linum tenue]|uniref:Aluminum-activated malate transporter n=1 Tax=Linum tenue TaxID=586396 RepID=A0AAV0R449_9ROSI|nr:unnamed protein product [Linum tenue]